jgi:apolipoprotein N-acyltransferase
MHDAVAVDAPTGGIGFAATLRAQVPTVAEASLIISSALFLILSFPNFELWPLAWIGLVPFLLVVARPIGVSRSLLLGWLWGAIFFYGTCWWLTYPMIHYANIPAWQAYPLLLLPIALVAIFPALFSLLLSRLVARFGLVSLFAAPILWVSCEWARYAVTGELWNALGYSQAFQPPLIQPARWGGVYAISFLLLVVNISVAFAVLKRSLRALVPSLALLISTSLVLAGAYVQFSPKASMSQPSITVIAVQPNVPMAGAADMEQLLNRHFELSEQALRNRPVDAPSATLVIWPESPMNFSYSRNQHLRDVITNFARSHHTFVLLNSLEPAQNGGDSNSAMMINEEGQIVARYDKIRLMPFGEYVPLPQWLPGASSVRGIVGDFVPGSSYTLMPLGAFRVGVFICIEAAHPGVARTFAAEGADALINISNDGYLGPTPVMRQHLSNAIFRAVENNRQLLRVTNNGISAEIDPSGKVMDATSAFEPTVRTWRLTQNMKDRTFYALHGDLFAYACALITLGLIAGTFRSRVPKARS